MTTRTTDRGLLERVYDQLPHRNERATVRWTTTGERLVAVAVGNADGHHLGVAHRPPGRVGASMPTEPLELARWAFDPPTRAPVEAAFGIATLNALSTPYISWTPGDPMEALTGEVECIATVGLFRPAFRKFDAVDVRVIEREPVGRIETPNGVSVSVFTPAEHEAAIAGVDVLFVTGSSLVYGGTSEYLRAAVDVPSVVLIGATASFLPGPAFEAGATVVAGARVADPDGVRAGVESGLCGTDLHHQGLEKVYATADPSPHGLDLEDQPADPPRRPE